MKTADFLFPKDLEITPTEYKKVLFIGSCLSETYVIRLRELNPHIAYDYILFNNAADLPEASEDEIGQYDLQYIQLPLRSVLTDAVIRIADNDRSDRPLDWVSVGQRNIDAMLEKAMAYNARTGILTFISNFIVPQGNLAPSLFDTDSEHDIARVVRELNAYLAQEVRKYTHAFIADVEMIANSLGKKFFLDDMIGFSTHGSVFYNDWSGHEKFPEWTAPAPGRLEEIPDLGLTYENRNEEFFEAAFRQIDAMYRTVKQTDMVKVVIFDLDNTMWRGQLVEHYQPGLKWPYSDGWPLGIWELVHHLRRRGIAVTIASKNDEELVVKKWADAVQPPFVKYEDFLAPQINWNPKAENIKQILDQLSLTPKSAVFVDDNPVERESVKALLPGIRVMGLDPFVIKRVLMCAPETQLAARSKESMRREEMFKQQFEREAEKSKMSREEFLMSLESKVKLWELADTTHLSFTRVFELVNKTNQFNTNGKRWSLEDYRSHFSAGGKLFAFSVADRFTDYGTVGVAFMCGGEFVQFIMSCRVLGMDIEQAVVSRLVKIARQDGAAAVKGSITETESNTPCRQLFAKCEFGEVDTNVFVLDGDASPASVDHVDMDFTPAGSCEKAAAA